MKNLRILWVDDDWDQPRLQLLADSLANELALRGVVAQFDKVLPNECVNCLAYQERYSLIITDYVFKRHTPPSNGAQIVQALSSLMKVVPPMILLTEYLGRPEYDEVIDNNGNRFYRKFCKIPTSITPLAKSILALANAPPINILILSDIHCGFAGRKKDARAKGFYGTFLRELATYTSQQWKIDYVLVSGDLAWRKQDDDLSEARDLLLDIMRILGLSEPQALQFCIGNHDLNLSNPANPLDQYERFLQSLKSTNDHYVVRYMAYQAKLRELGPMTERAQTLYTDFDPAGNVLFASLNSCSYSVRATESPTVRVSGEVGLAQWSALENSISDADQPRTNNLRIAFLHHPLFSTPGGHFDDEPPIADQAQAFHRLTKLGFHLAIHGHSHFACMYEQRMRVLNPSGKSEKTAKLVVIGAPTLGAYPSSTSPSRQYLVLSISAPLEGGQRNLSLQTRAYNEHNSQWSEGQCISAGQFSIDM